LEAAGPSPCLCGWRYDAIRSGMKWVAAISISLRVSRSYSAKNPRSSEQNLMGTARCRSIFRRIYFRRSQFASLLAQASRYTRSPRALRRHPPQFTCALFPSSSFALPVSCPCCIRPWLDPADRALFCGHARGAAIRSCARHGARRERGWRAYPAAPDRALCKRCSGTRPRRGACQ